MSTHKTILSVIFSFILAGISYGQFVDKVQYLMKFNESTCRYEVYLYVEEGTATIPVYRTQASGQISVVTPASSHIQMGTRYNPKQNNSTTPNFWAITVQEGAPTVDPDHNYYSITPALAPTSRYDQLVEGDTILLFDLVLFDAQHGSDGIRLYKNDIDLNGQDGLGGNYNNGMTIGTPNQLYNGNLAQVYPPAYADVVGPSTIFEGFSTTVVPAEGGTTQNLNPEIVSMDNDGNVTGIAAGNAEFLFQPTGGGCSSKTSVSVVSDNQAESIGIGGLDPHPSAILDVSSSEKGILIPRMSAFQRLNIPSPAEGLMVYQISGNKGFYYYSGNEWRLISHEAAPNNFGGGTMTATALAGSGNDAGLAEIMSKQSELEQILQKQTTEITALLQQSQK